MRRASAVLAGIVIGISAAMVAPPPSTAPTQAVPRPASPQPNAIVPVVCDDPIALSLPSPTLETDAADWSPDRTTLALGSRVYYRMGPYRPDEHRILVVTLAPLEVRDLARGTDPRWSADGARLAFRDLPPAPNEPTTDIIVYDVANYREVARIAITSRTPYGWRGDELLFWRDGALFTWRGGAESRVLDAPRSLSGVYVDVRYSGDGERIVLSYYRQQPGRESTPSEVYVLDTVAAKSELLIGSWLAAPSPRGHAIFAAFLDHRELRLEDGTIARTSLPFTGGEIVWGPSGRDPLLSPNELVAFGTVTELETIDGRQAGVATPTLLWNSGFNASGGIFGGVRLGGRGPSRLELLRCRATEPRPAPGNITLYYGESSIEPWAAKRDGTAPLGWEELVRRDLEMVGLHPIEIGRVRTLDGQSLCAAAACPNGFGLRVVVPYADRDRAYSRCFREPYAGALTLGAAISGFHCAPLYPAG
ncbi:MAG: hypothetical protein E6J13_14375 [Chloroflexi bacterium]|nr:MAG: hypothetical protein E6J13_14375 [Chloroflexota bacterium]